MLSDLSEDRIFRALANPLRRRILDALRDAPLTTGALVARFEKVDRCTVMQHLGVLEGAGLVVAARKGRERWNHLNVIPIQLLHDRWIGPLAAGAASGLARLEQALESPRTHPVSRDPAQP